MHQAEPEAAQFIERKVALLDIRSVVCVLRAYASQLVRQDLAGYA